MIPNHRMCDRFDSPPAQIIGLHEGLITSTKILDIPKWQDRSQTRVYQKIGGVFLATSIRVTIPTVENRIGGITGDISCGRNDGVCSSQRRYRITSQFSCSGQKY